MELLTSEKRGKLKHEFREIINSELNDESKELAYTRGSQIIRILIDDEILQQLFKLIEDNGNN
jgi:hypothetical protein